MKVVLDTNVILAGLATRGLCEAVVAVCLDQHQVVLSQFILDEVAEHLAGKFKLPTARVAERVSFFRSHGELVVPARIPADACRDPDDLAVLGTAVAGQADYIVTGDADLLTLKAWGKIPILLPRAFYEQLK